VTSTHFSAKKKIKLAKIIEMMEMAVLPHGDRKRARRERKGRKTVNCREAT